MDKYYIGYAVCVFIFFILVVSMIVEEITQETIITGEEIACRDVDNNLIKDAVCIEERRCGVFSKITWPTYCSGGGE